MWTRAKNVTERMPKWFRDDSLVHSVSDEVENVKLDSFYNSLCKYPLQPVQVWREITDTENTLCGRFLSIEEYPLKKISFYNSSGTTIYEESFKAYEPIYYKFHKIENSQLTTFYVGVQYHGFDGEILVGFPQQTTPSSAKYKFNESLDEVASTYGLTRRKYRTDIGQAELPYTFPPYYSYDIEQDYYFEQRILMEYFKREENITELEIQDESNNILAIITPKNFGSQLVDVSWYKKGLDEYSEILTDNQANADTDTTGFGTWSPNLYTTLTYDTNVKRTGAGAIRCDVSANDEYGALIYASQIPIIEGRYYRAHIWVKGTGTWAQPLIQFREDNTWLENKFGEIFSDWKGTWYDDDGDWHLLEVEGLAPERANNALLTLNGSCNAGEQWWWDDASFKEVAPICLKATEYKLYHENIEEEFIEYNITDLADAINDSKVISLELAEEGIPVNDVGTLSPYGLFQRFGGTKSEIYHHLGVIPEIRPITDYTLIWDVDQWNFGKVWGGEDYLPPNYYVDIPIDQIPTNFQHLSMDELQQVVDKFRPVGSKAMPRYSLEKQLELIFEPLDAGIQIAMTQDAGTPLEIFSEITDAFNQLDMSASVSISTLESSIFTITPVASVLAESAYIYEKINQINKSDFDDSTQKYQLEYANIITSSTSVLNDEFTSLSGWTVAAGNGSVTQGVGKTLNATGKVENGISQVILQTSGSALSDWWDTPENAPIIYRTMPNYSTDGHWRARVKIDYQEQFVNGQQGIMLYLNRDNAYLFGNTFELGTRDGIYLDKIVANVGTTTVASLSDTTYERYPYYLQIRYDGTNYHFEYSHNDESWLTVYSVASASLGFTPTSVGLFNKSSANINTHKMYVDNFKIDKNLTVEEALVPLQRATRTSYSCVTGTWTDNPNGTHYWGNPGGIAGSGVASAGNGYFGETEYLVGTFDCSQIPADAEILGIGIRFSMNNTQSGLLAGMMINIGNRGWTTDNMSRITSVAGWNQYEIGADHFQNLWGYTPPILGSELRTLLQARLFTQCYNVDVDWMSANIFYKHRSAYFITTTQIADTPSVGTGKLDYISGALINQQAGQTLKVDVIKESDQVSQTTSTSIIPIAHNYYREIAQSFVPGTTKITGMQFKSGAKTGSPTGDVTWRIQSDNGGSPGSTVLASGIIPSASMTDANIVEATLELDGLNSSSTYWVVLTGENPDENNYFNLYYSSANPYANGRTKFWRGDAWYDLDGGTADIWFKIKRPSVIHADVIPNFDMADWTYEDLKYKVKISSDSIYSSPKLKGFKITRKEVL